MWINDTYITSKADARMFLSSIGFDRFDIEDFITILTSDESLIDWKQEAKEWERDSMQQFEKRNGLIVDLQEVVDNLRAGKGTKVQIAQQIEDLCEFWY